ncbi:MAG: quinone oxidoreductase, partial [Microbacteriaceae bacterium]|nr:quinone oxidoreductase [Microbacteriaceae bacterium]
MPRGPCLPPCHSTTCRAGSVAIMKAIVISAPGDASVLRLEQLDDPVAGHGEVLVAVAAAGLNRADIAQREGNYPPPTGSPDWPGMEISGTIEAIGPGVDGWAVGDRVCALLAGGGYATKAVAQANLLLPVPADLDLIDAAGLPEVVATVWSNVFLTGRLRAGETLLVHGGSSGIGTMSIQLARAFGCL